MAKVNFKKATQRTYNLKDNSKFMCISCTRSENDYIDETTGQILPVYHIGGKPLSDEALKNKCKTDSEFPFFTIYSKPMELRKVFSIVANDKNGYSVSNSFELETDDSLLD